MTVVVPWKTDHGARAENWEWLRARWERLYPSWEIIESTLPAPTFSPAAAVNAGARRAVGRIIVVAYADVVVGDDWLMTAVEQVRDGVDAAIAPRVQARLGRIESLDVTGRPVDGDVVVDPHGDGVEDRRFDWPGLVVTTRDHMARYPFDERFTGWGYAGEAWMAATAAVGAPATRSGLAVHLWHPSPPTSTWGAYGASDARWLYSVYSKAAAAGDTDEIEALFAANRR